MTTWGVFTKLWNPHLSVVVGCAGLIVEYLVATRPSLGRAALYISGVVLLLLSLISPLDALGDAYLFSAHMLQHIVLILVVPPLLLLGLPAESVERLLHWRPAAAVERVLGQPLVAWSLGLGTLWLWHLPAFYDAVLEHEGLHIFQHLSFLVTATIFWWPVVASVPRVRRLGSLGAVFYLLLAGLASSVLGIIITFAPTGLYPAYLHPVDRLGVLSVVRGGWGLTPAVDQQVGGILMWMFGDPLILVAVLAVLVRWYSAPDDEDDDSIMYRRQTQPALAASYAGKE